MDSSHTYLFKELGDSQMKMSIAKNISMKKGQ